MKVDRDIEGIDRKPTAGMASNARLGLRLREEHGRGGTAKGVARARDISNRVNLSDRTILRMHSFFARHGAQQTAAGWEDRTDPSAQWIAWLLWGGDSGRRWARTRRDAIMAARKPKRRAARRAPVTRAAGKPPRLTVARSRRIVGKARRTQERAVLRAWSGALRAQRDRLIARLGAIDAARGVRAGLLTPTGTAPVRRVLIADDVAALFSVAAEALTIAEAVTNVIGATVQVGWGLFKAWLTAPDGRGIAWEPTLTPTPGLLAEQVTRVNETTKRQIEAEVIAGITAGESIGDIQERVRSSQAFSAARALTIARTETNRALQAGTDLAYGQAANIGVDFEVEWVRAPLPVEPDRSHRRCHGQRVAPGGMFVIPSGQDVGAAAPSPGGFGIARQDINCRCGTRPVFKD